MNPELNRMGLWTSYAMVLLVAFVSIHKVRQDRTGDPPPPHTPVLTVTSKGDLENDGVARLFFRLDEPARDRIEIDYRLGPEAAKQDRNFVVEPPAPLVINHGDRETSLTLTKRKPDPPRGKAVRDASKPVVITLSLANPEGAGYELAPRTSRDWKFPLTTPVFVGPYRVSMVSPGDFQEPDARKREERTIVFEVDRPPTDASISVRYRLGGTADSEDYEVVSPTRDNTLSFSPSDGKARLTLRRLPGPRGKGDRKVRVECVLPAGDAVVLAPGRGAVEIGISDPESKLSWSRKKLVEDPQNPGAPIEATLEVTITPPVSRTINLSYTVSVGSDSQNGSCVLKAPADPWAKDETKETCPIPIPSSDLVFTADGKRWVRIQATGELPNQLEPHEFTVHDSRIRSLKGHVFVVLVLTQGLTQVELKRIQETLDEAKRRDWQARLVGGTVFVLDAKRELSPFRLQALKDPERLFKRNAKTDEMLGEWSMTTFGRVQNLVRGKAFDKPALLLRDIADEKAGPVVDALSKGLIGQKWSIYWIDPAPRQSLLDSGLQEKLKEDSFKLKTPVRDLSKELLDLLENDSPND